MFYILNSYKNTIFNPMYSAEKPFFLFAYQSFLYTEIEVCRCQILPCKDVPCTEGIKIFIIIIVRVITLPAIR